MDVKALYPSLEVNQSLDILEEVVTNTPIIFEGVDWQEATKLLAVTSTKEARNLTSVIPIRSLDLVGRKYKVGLSYLDSDSSKGLNKWTWRVGRKPSTTQMKTIMAMVFRVMVRFIMTNHVYLFNIYLFNGEIFLQLRGGTIGLLISSVMASLVMIHWDKLYLKALEDKAIHLALYKRYVDDVNGGVTIDQVVLDLVTKEEEETLEAAVARTLREVANTIMPGMIQMVEDVPTNHDDSKLPILDLKSWVDPNNKILHTF